MKGVEDPLDPRKDYSPHAEEVEQKVLEGRMKADSLHAEEVEVAGGDCILPIRILPEVGAGKEQESTDRRVLERVPVVEEEEPHYPDSPIAR